MCWLLKERKMSVKAFWLVGKEHDEKEAYKLYLKELAELKLLKEKLESDVLALQKTRLKSEMFSNASWAFSQASINGEERALTKVIDLLNF